MTKYEFQSEFYSLVYFAFIASQEIDNKVISMCLPAHLQGIAAQLDTHDL